MSETPIWIHRWQDDGTLTADDNIPSFVNRDDVLDDHALWAAYEEAACALESAKQRILNALRAPTKGERTARMETIRPARVAIGLDEDDAT